MYKLVVFIFVLSISVLCDGKLDPPSDIISDVEFQKKLLECQQFCKQQDPKHDSEQTCKVLEERKLVLTECEINCLKPSKEEIDRASTCKCVSGKCVTSIQKNNSESIVKFIPCLISLIFVIFTLKFVI